MSSGFVFTASDERKRRATSPSSPKTSPSSKKQNLEQNPTAYLISQNATLQEEAQKARRSAERVSREKENVMKDLENSEKTRTCLKGLLHNAYESNKARTDLVQVSEDISAKGFKATETVCTVNIFASVVSTIILLACFGEDGVAKNLFKTEDIVWVVECMLTSVCFLTAFIWRNYVSASERASASAQTLRAEIDLAQSACAHIHEVIDEM